MAEVEMDQDASLHLASFVGRADDDLIDYDTDTADNFDGENNVLAKEQPEVEVHEVTTASTDLVTEATVTELEDHTSAAFLGVENPLDVEISADTVEIDLDVADQLGEHIEDAEGDIHSHDANTNNSHTEDLNLPATEDLDAGVSEGHAQALSATEDHNAQEIDYDTVESDPKTDFHASEQPNFTNDLGSLNENADFHLSPSKSEHSAAPQDDVNDATDQAEGAEVEITWEEEVTVDAEIPVQDGEQEGDAVSQHSKQETTNDGDVSGATDEHQVEATEFTQYEGNEEATHELTVDDETEHTHDQEVEDAAIAHSIAGSQELDHHEDVTTRSDSEHEEFPAITVHYKGGEFPFFSGHSEGFFSEMSALDDDMKSLMAGFRAELANEIASDEELVFQVDELGLEFAESSLDEAISAISLRQILEVFDILVKNQDPDNSRTLYTYLFTRPNTSKRFEFLVESATAGRGLDEVIHLFAPPKLAIEAASATDHLDDHLDAYESEEMQEVEEGFDAGQGSVEEIAEELGERSYEEDVDLDNIQDDDVDQMTTASPNHDHSMQTAEAEEFVDGEEQETNTAQGVDAVDETNEYQNGNMSEPAEADVENAVNEDAPEDDGDLAVAVESRPTADTSPTNTLEGDGETQSIPHDDDDAVDFTAGHEVDEVALVGEDDLAEIDWRHETDDADVSLDTSLGAGKRPRTDDELGVDDNQDAKRQRS